MCWCHNAVMGTGRPHGLGPRGIHHRRRAISRRGQALVEFAVVCLVVYMLLAAVLTFGQILSRPRRSRGPLTSPRGRSAARRFRRRRRASEVPFRSCMFFGATKTRIPAC